MTTPMHKSRHVNTLLSLVPITTENALLSRISHISNLPPSSFNESASLCLRYIKSSSHVTPIALIRYAVLHVLPNLYSDIPHRRTSRSTFALRLYLIAHILSRYDTKQITRLVSIALSLKPVVMPQSPITGYQFPSGIMTNSLNSSFGNYINYGEPETPQRL